MNTAELILGVIQFRKSMHTNDLARVPACDIMHSLIRKNQLAVRIDELDHVIEIIKSCIAEMEDDGK